MEPLFDLIASWSVNRVRMQLQVIMFLYILEGSRKS